MPSKSSAAATADDGWIPHPTAKKAISKKRKKAVLKGQVGITTFLAARPCAPTPPPCPPPLPPPLPPPMTVIEIPEPKSIVDDKDSAKSAAETPEDVPDLRSDLSCDEVDAEMVDTGDTPEDVRFFPLVNVKEVLEAVDPLIPRSLEAICAQKVPNAPRGGISNAPSKSSLCIREPAGVSLGERRMNDEVITALSNVFEFIIKPAHLNQMAKKLAISAQSVNQLRAPKKKTVHPRTLATSAAAATSSAADAVDAKRKQKKAACRAAIDAFTRSDGDTDVLFDLKFTSLGSHIRLTRRGIFDACDRMVALNAGNPKCPDYTYLHKLEGLEFQRLGRVPFSEEERLVRDFPTARLNITRMHGAETREWQVIISVMGQCDKYIGVELLVCVHALLSFFLWKLGSRSSLELVDPQHVIEVINIVHSNSLTLGNVTTFGLQVFVTILMQNPVKYMGKDGTVSEFRVIPGNVLAVLNFKISIRLGKGRKIYFIGNVGTPIFRFWAVPCKDAKHMQLFTSVFIEIWNVIRRTPPEVLSKLFPPGVLQGNRMSTV